jgi:hypothetical protein
MHAQWLGWCQVRLILVNATAMALSRMFIAMPHANPECFIAYAPRGGLLCAVMYVARGDDLCGWWIGRDEGAEYRSAYFLIERYYTQREGAFFATLDNDLRGGWRVDYKAKHPMLDKPASVDDALAHELEHLQLSFVREWLVYAEDAHAAAEAAYYQQAELAMGELAVKHRQLGKFDKTQPTWRHYSHGCDGNVLQQLMRQWPLFYKLASDEDQPLLVHNPCGRRCACSWRRHCFRYRPSRRWQRRSDRRWRGVSPSLTRSWPLF